MSVNGGDLLKQVRREDPDAAVVLLTANWSREIVTECLELGAFDVLPKPMHVDRLLIAADRAVERRQLMGERRR